MVRWSSLLALLSIVPVGRADDWPQFLGPNRDGVSKETGLKAWGAQGPPLAWKRDVGPGYAGAVTSGDRLIVFHRVGDEELVQCWDAASGKDRWKFAYATEFADDFNKGNGPRSTPCIAGAHVVTLGADGKLHCLSLTDGKKIWARDLFKEYGAGPGYFGVGTSPLVVDNLVLVNVGGRAAGIVAFALDTGKETWKATRDAAGYASPILATVDGARLAVFFTREGAVILEPKTGEVLFQKRWRARIDASVNAATPLILGDQAFFSTSYDTGALLLKLKKTGADEVWNSDELMTNHYNTCVFHEGHLFGFHGRQEAGPSFRCLDVKNQKVTWNQDRFGCGSMIVADGKLIVLTERGELILAEANPQAYRELARAAVFRSGSVRAQIALANGRLYARDQQTLACFMVK